MSDRLGTLFRSAGFKWERWTSGRVYASRGGDHYRFESERHAVLWLLDTSARARLADSRRAAQLKRRKAAHTRNSAYVTPHRESLLDWLVAQRRCCKV